MPSSRRLKVTGLVALLTVCVIFYITNGASSTHNSEFYQRTLTAIQQKQSTRAREDVLAEERQRLARISQVEKEHNAALSKAQQLIPTTAAHVGPDRQAPIMDSVKAAASQAADAISNGKSVAGRKYMKDGKVVTYKSAEDAENDGVAKVGNVDPQSSHAAIKDKAEKPDDPEVTAELNDILKKGPIIIFSKTFCPFSKKAKHILLDLYDITPPPYVVELDAHDLGQGLQSALERLTGRRTVPNVLINGMSIGGGDDVEDLHVRGELPNKIKSLGGKRIMEIERLKQETKRMEMRFKA